MQLLAYSKLSKIADQQLGLSASLRSPGTVSGTWPSPSCELDSFEPTCESGPVSRPVSAASPLQNSLCVTQPWRMLVASRVPVNPAAIFFFSSLSRVLPGHALLVFRRSRLGCG